MGLGHKNTVTVINEICSIGPLMLQYTKHTDKHHFDVIMKLIFKIC